MNRLPGLRRYYATLTQLDSERIGALRALEKHQIEANTRESLLREEASRLVAERNALREERGALTERLAAKAAFEDQFNHLLVKLDNVSAQTLGVGARQEEAVARLGRQLGGDRAAPGGDGSAADLYLDLLEASLTGLLIEDGSQAPWTERKFDPSLRAIGRDWPEQAITMIGTARMRNLRMLTTQALEEGVPGDFIETGVWRGGACIYAKGIFKAYGAKDRKVFVADSFRGLPEPDASRNPADTGDTHHTYAQLAVSREVVAGNFRRYGLLDEQVVFLEGWFKDTLPVAPIDRLAVLRLDGDMYESTMDALHALYHKVSPGGFVIVDDYVLEPCARAIHDFREQQGIEAPMHPVDGAAVWWRVPV
ncbi:TylF/MycF family methyltransferase [Bosea sp. BIWAKO-01]|uniref:TylF/MycF family methyltransferase n=1 Tax=Bosea sp. BIWAKO-01 TaxID=506668 RepID=UPI001FCD4257|nr:TylF/MycF family methyltransferase [Bosea sp. BIWAKO-01]